MHDSSPAVYAYIHTELEIRVCEWGPPVNMYGTFVHNDTHTQTRCIHRALLIHPRFGILTHMQPHVHVYRDDHPVTVAACKLGSVVGHEPNGLTTRTGTTRWD